MAFIPYANEADALQLAEFNIENRLDRVSLFGSLDLTRDQTGLQHALRLQALLNDVVRALQAETELPQQVAQADIETGPNPFA
ncbi:hypothetical protein JCM19000A_18240 [Silvimonas sp. JCM 19000]